MRRGMGIVRENDGTWRIWCHNVELAGPGRRIRDCGARVYRKTANSGRTSEVSGPGKAAEIRRPRQAGPPDRRAQTGSASQVEGAKRGARQSSSASPGKASILTQPACAA